MDESNPTIVSETLKYSDGTEKVVNFTDIVDQSIPEETPVETVEETPVSPIEEAPIASVDEPEVSEPEE